MPSRCLQIIDICSLPHLGNLWLGYAFDLLVLSHTTNPRINLAPGILLSWSHNTVYTKPLCHPGHFSKYFT